MNPRTRRLRRARRSARTPVTVRVHPSWPELRITGPAGALNNMMRDLGLRTDRTVAGRPAMLTITWAVGMGQPFRRCEERAAQIRAWAAAHT